MALWELITNRTGDDSEQKESPQPLGHSLHTGYRVQGHDEVTV